MDPRGAPVIILFLQQFCSALASSAPSIPSFAITPDNVFSKGRQFYRHLLLDEDRNVLYVGGMNHLYKLWMFNINDTGNTAFYAERELEPSPDSLSRCAYRSHDPNFHCQNHVRVVFRLPDDSLYVCSTNAYSPTVTKLDSATLAVVESELSGAAICPVDPTDNGTAVWVAEGNPGGVPSVYAAAVTDATQTNRIIYRPPLINADGDVLQPFMRTMHTDSKWLNEPNFVGSLERGKYVYFFFRENAVEFSNCGSAVYSRVARICKNDVGGRYLLKQNWATYVKARLNCSLPGQYPFNFDQIQDVYEVDGTVYGAFTTGQSGFSGSAVCAMRLADIDSVLDAGVFKAQERSDSAWLPVQPSAVPSPRPGQCPSPGAQISDTTLHFIKTHPLLHDTVPSVGGAPLFYVADRAFSRIVVDRLGPGSLAIFTADTSGRILKLGYSEGEKAVALASYQLPAAGPVTALRLLRSEFVYAAQDSGVSQVEVGQCGSYASCGLCARDPYCAWNSMRSVCRRSKDAFRMTAGWVVDDVGACRDELLRERRMAYPGDSLHLRCPGGDAWRKDTQPLLAQPSDRLFRTSDGGLILLNLSRSDQGTYDCFKDAQITASYDLDVDHVNCEKPSSATAFVSVYRDWCREFQEYKSTMLKWKEWYSQKAECGRSRPPPGLPARNRSEAKSNALGRR